MNGNWRLLLATTLLMGLGVAVPAAPVAATPRAPAKFSHPGVLISRGNLDRVRKNLKKEPWKSAYAKMKKDPLASLKRRARPLATVECGPYNKPDLGCTTEIDDSMAAYTQALMWYYTRDPRRALKAIDYLDAWSGKLKEHTNANAPLQAGWAAINWTKAAEIMKHTTSKKTWPKRDRVATMLRTAFLPLVINGQPGQVNGNWELVMADAVISIGVHLDDRAVFDQGVALWRRRVPAYFYLRTDGATPLQPPGGVPDIVAFWQGQKTFVDGLTQETCRDLNHTSWGLSATMQAAETARIQGVNLFKEQEHRLVTALEFNTKWAYAKLKKKPIPRWLCDGVLNRQMKPGLEVGYAAYRKRHKLPNTKKMVLYQRPAGKSIFESWETLTAA